MLRRYEIVAIPIRIVYNTFGDHDPNGQMYVLEGDRSEVERLVDENPLMPVDLVRPLVIRANVADQVEITLENALPVPASINIKGLSYDVRTSDGVFAGENPDTTVDPGEKIVYSFVAHQKGCYHFGDLGNPLASEIGSNLHGLFGAIVIEAPGSSWRSPETGEGVDSGTVVDVLNPFLPALREYVTIFHDEAAVLDKDGNPPVDPVTGQPEATHSINYRAEPMRNRMRLIEEGEVCPGCIGEEVHHDSWAFGDPATPVLRAYRGDPTRFHVVHGGVKETHIFHLHVHQWLFDPDDPGSDQNDSREMSPQGSFTFDVLYGAGSLHRTYGDAIFHCHLYPHFGEGMWGIYRTHDVLEDGTRVYPSGQPISRLLPLPGREPPPEPTAERPGFPFFIPGVYKERSPLPPLGAGRDFPPTPLEEAAFAENAVPGAVFTNACPEGAPVRHYDVVAIQTDIVYNEAGWHDPEGRLYVLAEDEQAVMTGAKEPEPFIIRANAGECIELTFTNKIPRTLGPSAFQVFSETPFCGMHVHFVKFDPLVADGANVGWNYFSGAEEGRQISYRWFADTELRTVFFHDHLFATLHQQHGVFAALIVEPRGSRFKDPETGMPITAGTKATIQNPFIPDFREFALAVHDFTPLFTQDGVPLNPPGVPGVLEDQGVMAVNYKNAPFQIRPGDAAWVFSSFLHGDPKTPLLETYVGDPVRIRLFQGAHEESHAFNLHRQKWLFEANDVNSPLTQEKHIGISEAFNLHFAVEGDIGKDFDMLYYSGGLDDLWLGVWGIMRAYGQLVPGLLPLSDREAPPPRTVPRPVKTGNPPPEATDPGSPCPPGVPVKHFDVVAVQKRIDYNNHGDHDPLGMFYVLEDDMTAVLSGQEQPEPLILRANAGDCVEVRLTNGLPAELPGHDHPVVPVDAPWPYSSRVSMHAQLVKYDVLGSDGAAVGFNPDQTIDTGGTRTYRWFVESPNLNVNLWDMADIRNHRHHGLFGALIVEPRGSRYKDRTRGKGRHSQPRAQADILNPFLPRIREIVLLMHDGVFLLNAQGQVIPQAFTVVPIPPEELDPEDQGMRAFSYRTEPFENRLKTVPQVHKVFSSLVHGDPATPVFEAVLGEPLAVRLLMPGDKPRGHSFMLHAHNHLQQPGDLLSQVIAVRSGVTVGSGLSNHLIGGLSPAGTPGDFIYRSGLLRWDLELGMWGILRVRDKDDEELPGPVCPSCRIPTAVGYLIFADCLTINSGACGDWGLRVVDQAPRLSRGLKTTPRSSGSC